MKKIIVLLGIFLSVNLSAQEKISSYLKSTENFESFDACVKIVKDRISNSSYKLLGTYNPENNSQQMVIVFTSDKLIEFSNKFTDRGALAAPIKVAIRKSNEKIELSIANPEYIFNAYWGKDASNDDLLKMKDLSKELVKNILGSQTLGFGGSLSAKELAKYHYKITMPYFTDPIELKEFESFDRAIGSIENNLKTNKNAKLVYKLQIPNKDICVYGIALSGENGESKFLPKIGQENLAAMPYEIIVQNKKATMLHAKYRLALSWPELSMGQFMKIMSTPGDIEDIAKSVCK